MITLDNWLTNILADPISKTSKEVSHFPRVDNILDARVSLKNTLGYKTWDEGQIFYETLAINEANDLQNIFDEIENDRPIYKHFKINGRVLDCGGGAGVVREFLSDNTEYVSVDPWIQAPFSNSENRIKAYKCLQTPLNFIAGNAEFLPFLENSFDWVHMRSMLDHVQVPDLAILEAWRVLKPGGRLLVGLYVEGGKTGVIPLKTELKEKIKDFLALCKISKWKDYHVWHPTIESLSKLISDNRLEIDNIFWQPNFPDTVCYVSAKKPAQNK